MLELTALYHISERLLLVLCNNDKLELLLYKSDGVQCQFLWHVEKHFCTTYNKYIFHLNEQISTKNFIFTI
jgi:hypothetical protein